MITIFKTHKFPTIKIISEIRKHTREVNFILNYQNIQNPLLPNFIVSTNEPSLFLQSNLQEKIDNLLKSLKNLIKTHKNLVPNY